MTPYSAQQHKNPAGHAAGIIAVVLFHIVLVWAFMNGLMNKVHLSVPSTDVKVIDEIKPPPPKEVPVPLQPKLTTPPDATIPLPDLQISAPPLENQSMTGTTLAPPSDPVSSPLRTEGRANAAPNLAVGVACPNSSAVQKDTPYPREALRDNVQGEVIVRFTVSAAGDLLNAAVAKSSGNRYLDRAALAASQKFQCRGQGQDVSVEAPFSFRME